MRDHKPRQLGERLGKGEVKANRRFAGQLQQGKLFMMGLERDSKKKQRVGR